MSQDFESKTDRINRESAGKRDRGEYPPDPRKTAQDKARRFVDQAEKCAERARPGDAEWTTAFATLALATLALSEVTTPTPGTEYM